ncbi:Chitin synthase, class 1, partial [Cladochytrium tenue]
CNLHDVSWGTKGDDRPVHDVAPINTAPSSHGLPVVVVTDLPMQQSDVEGIYERFLEELPRYHAAGGGGGGGGGRGSWAAGKKPVVAAADPQGQEDFFRMFRTRVVLLWLLTNVLLVVALTTPAVAGFLGVVEDGTPGGRSNAYLTVLLWVFVGLSVVRFLEPYTGVHNPYVIS